MMMTTIDDFSRGAPIRFRLLYLVTFSRIVLIVIIAIAFSDIRGVLFFTCSSSIFLCFRVTGTFSGGEGPPISFPFPLFNFLFASLNVILMYNIDYWSYNIMPPTPFFVPLSSLELAIVLPSRGVFWRK